MVQQAAQYGMSLTVLVQGTPAWANGGKGRQWVPDNVQDYADFMYAISRRYPSIHRWMVWGEVNYGANFQPMPDHSPVGPRAYAQLCDAAYVALKQADPANIVIGGDTLNANVPVSPAEFIRWARVGKGKKKRPPRLDWWGHNPFEGRFPDIRQPALNNLLGLSDADTMHKLLKKAYLGKKKKGKKRGRRASASAVYISKKGKKEAPPLDAADLVLRVHGSLHPSGPLLPGLLRLGPGAGAVGDRRLPARQQPALRQGTRVVPPR